MKLVDIDVVGLKPSETVFYSPHHPSPAVARHVGLVTHLAVHFGCEHDVVAASLKSTTNDFFGFAGRVEVSRVYKVDAGVEGSIDDTDVVGFVCLGEPAEVQAPQAVCTDFHARSAQRAHAHLTFLSAAGRVRPV